MKNNNSVMVGAAFHRRPLSPVVGAAFHRRPLSPVVGAAFHRRPLRPLLLLAVLMITLCAIFISGCKSIEVERNGQALATVENADGTTSVVKDAAGNPIILDRGWTAEYFQHWNWQEFDSMKVAAGQGVSLEINGYKGGADPTNLTALVATSFAGSTNLVTAIGTTYAQIAGGGAQASTILTVAQKVYAYFTSAGGDASKATVTTSDNSVKVTDGTTCVICDASGNCSTCTDTE